MTLRNSGSMREPRQALHAEVKDRPGFRSGERRSAQVAAVAVASRNDCAGVQRGGSPILLLLGRLRATFRGRRHASCPRAGCGRSARPVRGAATGNGAMAWLVGHREPKGAETEMPRLSPPRQSSTLPTAADELPPIGHPASGRSGDDLRKFVQLASDQISVT